MVDNSEGLLSPPSLFLSGLNSPCCNLDGVVTTEWRSSVNLLLSSNVIIISGVNPDPVVNVEA